MLVKHLLSPPVLGEHAIPVSRHGQGCLLLLSGLHMELGQIDMEDEHSILGIQGISNCSSIKLYLAFSLMFHHMGMGGVWGFICCNWCDKSDQNYSYITINLSQHWGGFPIFSLYNNSIVKRKGYISPKHAFRFL